MHAAVVTLHDHQIVVENRRHTVAYAGRTERSQILLPKLFALEVVGVQTFTAKECKHVFAVGGRSGRCKAGFLVTTVLDRAFVGHPFPKDLPSVAVDTDNL